MCGMLSEFLGLNGAVWVVGLFDCGLVSGVECCVGGLCVVGCCNGVFVRC